MIHYQLRCDGGHGFESWFRSSESFEAQSRAGLIECPACGSHGVERALMAPAIARRGRAEEPAAASGPAAPPEPVPAPPAMPDAVRAGLQRIRAEVERNCEHVGPRFAEEARAIHRGESPVRGIYGEATPDQADALARDGIEVSRIPWVPRADG